MTSPETTDKKALKLARRRILFNFAEREENQEALVGFRSGLVISIPAPSPCLSHDVDWRQLVLSLVLVPADRCAWLIRDIIATAAAVCGRGNVHPLLATKLQRALRRLLRPPFVLPHQAHEAKRRALGYLRFPPVDRHGRKQPMPQLLSAQATAIAQAHHHGGATDPSGLTQRTPGPGGPGAGLGAGVGSSHAFPPITTTSSSSSSSSSLYDELIDDRGFHFLCATRLVGADGRAPSPPHTAEGTTALAHFLEDVPASAFAAWARQTQHMFVRFAAMESKRLAAGSGSGSGSGSAQKGSVGMGMATHGHDYASMMAGEGGEYHTMDEMDGQGGNVPGGAQVATTTDQHTSSRYYYKPFFRY